MAKCEGEVMDGPLKGQRLIHWSGTYVLEVMDNLPSMFAGPTADVPIPSRSRVGYVFNDGANKRTAPGWYLQ